MKIYNHKDVQISSTAWHNCAHVITIFGREIFIFYRYCGDCNNFWEPGDIHIYKKDKIK